MRVYKHKFSLVDGKGNQTEVATCSDEMTANFLADYYREVYQGNTQGLQVVYRFKSNDRLIAK